MPILIVDSDADRGEAWCRQIEEGGRDAILVQTSTEAVHVLQTRAIRIIVLSLDLSGGDALSVADFAGYRQPEIKIIALTGTGKYADGSIFAQAANICAFLPASTPAQDIAALVDHYGRST